MIYDKLENISKYELPLCVVDFIAGLDESVPLGKHILSEDCYANVEEYYTKEHELCFFENHRIYTDIQIVIVGQERLDFYLKNDLKVKEQYNKSRDIEFFYLPEKSHNSLELLNGYFTILNPGEAHRPQMNYCDKTCKVKKVVVKIKSN